MEVKLKPGLSVFKAGILSPPLCSYFRLLELEGRDCAEELPASHCVSGEGRAWSFQNQPLLPGVLIVEWFSATVAIVTPLLVRILFTFATPPPSCSAVTGTPTCYSDKQAVSISGIRISCPSPGSLSARLPVNMQVSA